MSDKRKRKAQTRPALENCQMPKRKASKRLSASAQLEEIDSGQVNLTSPNSILANINLRNLLNRHTLGLLSAAAQHQLIKELPECDRTRAPDNSIRVASTALNNEFFNKSCVEWRQRLKNGEFTPENQSKLEEDQKQKDVITIDDWKKKFFEPVYGKKSVNNIFEERPTRKEQQTQKSNSDAEPEIADISPEIPLKTRSKKKKRKKSPSSTKTKVDVSPRKKKVVPPIRIKNITKVPEVIAPSMSHSPSPIDNKSSPTPPPETKPCSSLSPTSTSTPSPPPPLPPPPPPEVTPSIKDRNSTIRSLLQSNVKVHIKKESSKNAWTVAPPTSAPLAPVTTSPIATPSARPHSAILQCLTSAKKGSSPLQASAAPPDEQQFPHGSTRTLAQIKAQMLAKKRQQLKNRGGPVDTQRSQVIMEQVLGKTSLSSSTPHRTPLLMPVVANQNNLHNQAPNIHMMQSKSVVLMQPPTPTLPPPPQPAPKSQVITISMRNDLEKIIKNSNLNLNVIQEQAKCTECSDLTKCANCTMIS